MRGMGEDGGDDVAVLTDSRFGCGLVGAAIGGAKTDGADDM